MNLMYEPDLAQFDAMVRAAYERLPKQFRAQCDGLVIRVTDFADWDTLNAMGIHNPYGLLGLYQGVDLTRKSSWESGSLPDMVFLYRRPILAMAAEGGDTLDHIVTHVLVHEIGHHFGLSDEDMHAIEERAERG